MRKYVRIFVSSPGDVGAERVIADRVIRRLQREYCNSIDIKPILWENLPLMPTSTFQDGIDVLLKSAPIDVAIFILGARLGSSPGQNYIRADGTPYGSGTEYEFDMMMEAYRRSGRPMILFYKKDIPEQQILFGKGISEAENVIRQFKAVNQFVEEHFYDKEKGAYIAYHLLDDKSVGFEQRLEAHLREILEKALPSQESPKWSGNPYKGLLSFEVEDEAIFFGRSTALNEIEREIFARCSSEQQELPCVIVSGESGAGKSSFVKAGLLPDLLRTTMFPKSRVEYRIATPGQWGGRACERLWQMLKEMLPGLPDLPQKASTEIEFVETVAATLKNAILKHVDETGLCLVPLLVVDQLEEVFTNADIPENERTHLAWLLSALQKSNCVLPIITIRNDFYHDLTGSCEWLSVKKDALLYDLPRMTIDEYKQIITAPAELAGYKWERAERGGRRLDEVILDDAIKQQVPLPLLEFALADIVERCGDGKVLKFSDYRGVGGVEGAIQKRADELFKALSSGEKEAFSRLLGYLVTVNPMGGKYVRSVVAIKMVESDKTMRKVTDAFVANRLFAVSGGEGNEATVTIAHETLISQWKVIQDWIDREHQLILAKWECEVAAEKWYSCKKDNLLLLTNPAALAQAEDLLICWQHGVPEPVRRFLAKSFRRSTRRFISIRVVAVLLAALGFVSGVACFVSPEYSDCQREILSRIYETEREFKSGILILAIEMPIITTLLLYSLVQRFRGMPRYVRAKSDLIVYLTGFLLFILATCIEEFFYPTDERGLSWFLGTGVLGLGAPFFLVLRSFFRVRYVSLRRRRLRSFRFRQPVVVALSGRFAVTISAVVATIVFCGMLFFLGSTVSDGINAKEQYVLMAEQFVDGKGLDVCEGIIKTLSARRQENEFITSREAKTLIKAKLAVGKVDEVLSDTNLLQSIDESIEKANLMYRCHSAVGDVESAYHWAKDDIMCDEYVKLFLALELGKTDDAQTIFPRLPPPPLFPLSPQLVNYAHGMLLCSNCLSEAVAVYREIEKDSNLRNSLLSDFVLLKRQKNYRSRIMEVEKQLASVPIPALEGEMLDIHKDMPWFSGAWRWTFGNGEYGYDMVLDPAHTINCRYSLSSKGVKVRSSYSIIRIQREQDFHVYKVEEFDPQRGIISVGVWGLKDDNTIEATVLFNGYDMEKGQKRLYRRLSTNEIAVVREVYPNTPAALQGLRAGDICCEYSDFDCLGDYSMLEGLITTFEEEKQKLVVARKNDTGVFEIQSFEFSPDEMERISIAPVTAYVADWEALNKVWHEYNTKKESALQ